MNDEKGKQKPLRTGINCLGKTCFAMNKAPNEPIHMEAMLRGKITTQSLTSVTPSAEIWNRASASAKQGELITLQIRSSPRPFRRASLWGGDSNL